MFAKIALLLALAVTAFADDVDDLNWDDEFVPVDYQWNLGMTGGTPSDSSYPNYLSLDVSKRWSTAWRTLEFSAWTGLALSAYDWEGIRMYTVEPSLSLGMFGNWSETNLTLWGSRDWEGENTWGVNAQSLIQVSKWDGGRILLGPTIESSPISGDFAGLRLRVSQVWTVQQVWHGPVFEINGSADLSSTGSTQGMGNSTMTTWSNSNVDVSYRLGWESSSGAWGAKSQVGYALTQSSLRGARGGMESSSAAAGDGVWANVRFERNW